MSSVGALWTSKSVNGQLMAFNAAKINCCRDWYCFLFFLTHRILSYFYRIWHRFTVVVCLYVHLPIFTLVCASIICCTIMSIKNIISKYFNSNSTTTNDFMMLWDSIAFSIYGLLYKVYFRWLFEVFERAKIKRIRIFIGKLWSVFLSMQLQNVHRIRESKQYYFLFLKEK